MRLKKFFGLLLPVLVLMQLVSGIAGAALLDVGPVVTEVNPSTEGTFGRGNPPLGHGFPLWYRDNNRVPLQLCTDRLSGMCLTAEPNPAAPLSFPANMGDELFWWVGDAIIDIPTQGDLTRPGQALLVQAVEAAYSTGSPVSGAQVSFARMRIRIDTPYVGLYTVSTPFKQYTFNVTDTANGINMTEDVGIAAAGDYSGALQGSVGPFLYCTTAPIAVPGSGLYLGNPNVPCTVLGSTFPSAQNPTNFFRVQGPNAFDVQTTLFNISGKIYEGDIPTLLTVDKVAYARNAADTEMQVNAFATSLPLSNQRNLAAAFPGNFALTGAASTLQVTGTGLPTQDMTTNAPADGKFFTSSGLFAPPGGLPATVTVTNTADTPPTAKTVPLVDEVVIENAVYNPLTKILSVLAASYDKKADPNLQAFMPGMTASLGTLTNGRLDVTFPVVDNSGPQTITYEIPPKTITVVSALEGTASAPVTTLIPPLAPVTSVSVVPNKTTPQLEGTSIVVNASATGGTGIYEYRFQLHDGAVWSLVQDFSASASWAWSNTLPGSYTIAVTARNAGIVGEIGSATTQINYVISPLPPPATAATITVTQATPQVPNTPITFIAAGSGGSGSYEYQFWLNSGAGYTMTQAYSVANSWTWTPTNTGTYDLLVDVRNVGSSAVRETSANFFQYKIATPATTVTMAESLASPQAPGTPITFTATATGGSGPYDYRFWVNEGNGYAIAQNYGSGNTFIWTPTKGGFYDIMVDTRIVNSAAFRDALVTKLAYHVTPLPATAVTITPSVASPQLPGATVTFTATASGGTGPYEYRYWINSGGTFMVAQNYTTTNTFAWTPVVAGNYDIMVDTRAVGSTAFREALNVNSFYQIKPALASGVTATADKTSPQPINAPIVITAAGSGGSGSYEYRFWLNSGSGYTVVQDYSTLRTWTWFPPATGNFDILIDVRNAGTTTVRDAATNIFFYQIQ